jgi:hypothetical protein
MNARRGSRKLQAAGQDLEARYEGRGGGSKGGGGVVTGPSARWDNRGSAWDSRVR